MNIGMFLAAILIPICITIVFTAIQISNSKANNKMSDQHFTVRLPKPVLFIGIIGDVMFVMVVLGFTIFSEELPHIILYIIFGLFTCLFTLLILKTLRFKVTVKGEEITVQNIFGKPYTFTFNEIISAKRQTKNNKLKSERIVVRTISGKKLVVESSETSYNRFLKIVKLKVKSEYLYGFN